MNYYWPDRKLAGAPAWQEPPRCPVCGFDILWCEKRSTAKDGVVTHEHCVHKSRH